ncbi:MAG TPA: ATP-binding protein [Candidatus Ozemobacteraceae bacterium]|nr:ATP-binding protein [Candidatus Ozemobacteraceae bacterium]
MAIVQPVEGSESSTVRISPEGLSVHMRIPAERIYLANATLTLREICDHLCLSDERTGRVVLAVEEALMNSIEHAYNGSGGQIDLQFSVEGTEFVIVVEDFGNGMAREREIDTLSGSDLLFERGRGMRIMKGISDKAVVQTSAGRGTRATMLFQLNHNED